MRVEYQSHSFFSHTDDRFIILKTKTKFMMNFHEVKTKFLYVCKQKEEGKERNEKGLI